MQGHVSLSIIGEAWPLQLHQHAGTCQLGLEFNCCLCAEVSTHFAKLPYLGTIFGAPGEEGGGGEWGGGVELEEFEEGD